MYCSVSCQRLVFREEHPEKYRASLKKASAKRYQEDPDYRARGIERHRGFREANRAHVNRQAREYYQVRTYGRVIGDDPLAHSKDRFRAARALGYRSGLEVQVASELTEAGVEFLYEGFRIPWMPEPRLSHYTPDYLLTQFGWVLESKGRWVTADRKKIKTVIKQHPEIELRIVFANAQARISKTSKTTYAAYCDSLGILWAHRHVPKGWLTGPVNHVSMAAVKRLMEAQKKK